MVGGAKTSSEILQRAMRFYASVKKHPILLRKEATGHVANRLQDLTLARNAHANSLKLDRRSICGHALQGHGESHAGIPAARE